MRLLVLAVPLFWVTSCSTVGYYSQAVGGQLEIFRKQRPIENVLADPASGEDLKRRLRLVGDIRAFAGSRLSLPGAKTHYGRYADLGRKFVVWNVFAAPEFEIEPQTWWYPIVGSLEYRGFFAKEDALEFAKKIKAKGNDVSVGGVVAYSTLGFFRDPVLNTFIADPETELAGLLFHELTHHRFFLKGDTAFSEGLATAVEEEGLRLWVEHRGSPELRREYQIYLKHRNDFVSLISQTRAEIERLYATTPRETPSQISALRSAKSEIFSRLKARYRSMKSARWDGYDGYDPWFARDLNNAHLNTVATYSDLVPGFKKLLREANHDFDAFFKAVASIAKLPKSERRSRLSAP